MTKIAAGIAFAEIETSIRDLNTITSIMATVVAYVPKEEIKPEWFEFFARAIDQVTHHIEEVMGRVE
jgi:hypothetical protein